MTRETTVHTESKPLNGYIALFKGRRAEIRAASLYAASEEARRLFKPSKRDVGLLSVNLAELAGEQVTTTADT